LVTFLRKLRSAIPFLVIFGAFVWAAASIASRRVVETSPDVITIRIAHWQLEAGVREAFTVMAEEYRKIHPNVRVLQDVIPEGTYPQWASTQLIGGTAPDAIEVWMGLTNAIWVSYLNRYFERLTPLVSKPNPYNRGTDIEHVPFRQTYLDGMRGSYVEQMQEYMLIPLAQTAVRIFYNRELLKKLTGLDAPPTEYRAFLKVCEQIAAARDASGSHYTPIAASSYNFGMWDDSMFNVPSYGAVRKADFNRDGYVGNDEMFVAFQSGRLNLHFPNFVTRFKMMSEVSAYFPHGYIGLNRDDALFLFAQQKSVFMTTGTWDALSLQAQTEGQFSVGVMDFPIPSRDDPEYGPTIDGPRYERPSTAFSFGVTRFSKHPEVMIDFLQFCASRENNQKLNALIGWIPAIEGAKIDPFLTGFKPRLNGVYPSMEMILGGETNVTWSQLFSAYQVGQITFDEFARQWEAKYKVDGRKDFDEQQRDWRRGILNDEQFLAGVRATALMASGPEADARWVKYRALTAGRQVGPEIGHAIQLKLVNDGPDPNAPGPYEYSKEVLAKIKARLTSDRAN